MATLLGTSGFSYDEWKGLFYPADLPKDDYLRYYSLFFPFVELDFSYYRMPEGWRLERMAESTPTGFLFAIKAHRSLTHDIDRDWPAAAAEFRAAISARPFHERLAAIVLQFPAGFRYDGVNRIYLGELIEELTGFPLCVEFRNTEWNGGRVTEEADRRGIAIVAVDPPFGPRVFRTSGPFSYLRFHGGYADVQGYSYSDAELNYWVPAVLEAEKKAQIVLAAFNNHRGGKSIHDARRFKELLDIARRASGSFDDGPGKRATQFF